MGKLDWEGVGEGEGVGRGCWIEREGRESLRGLLERGGSRGGGVIPEDFEGDGMRLFDTVDC